MNTRLCLLAAAALAVGGVASPTLAASAPAALSASAQKAPGVSPAQAARKARSERMLKAEGVPFIGWLPVVEDEADFQPRTVEEIAARAYALTMVAHKATTGDHQGANRALDVVRDRVALSPAEATFMRDPSPSQADLIHFSWASEAAYPLFWMMGYLTTMARPDEELDPGPMALLVVGQSLDGLVAGAKLRPQAEMLDALDLTYRYHWAAREARLNDEPVPGGLNVDVLMERHKALNWLVRYNDDAGWDDVTTDT